MALCLLLMGYCLILETMGCSCLKFAPLSATYLMKSAYMLSSWGSECLSNNPHIAHDTADWVPNDPRRHGVDEDGSAISGLDFFIHIDDTQFPSNLDRTQVITAITNAVNTWDNVPCTKNKFNLIISNEHNSEGIGYAEYIMSEGRSGSNVKIGDIVFGGFVPPDLFTIAVANELKNKSVGAVTVLFDYNDEIMYENEGEIAFAEIYFNDDFSWDILEESVPNVYDVETVALHELGHALSQSHFHPSGKSISEVVMTPVYFGVNHDLHGVDIGAHCAKWAQWGTANPSSSTSIPLFESPFYLIVVCLVFIECIIVILCCCNYLCGFMSMKKKKYHLAQSTDEDDDDDIESL
eukprot:488362_1